MLQHRAGNFAHKLHRPEKRKELRIKKRLIKVEAGFQLQWVGMGVRDRKGGKD